MKNLMFLIVQAIRRIMVNRMEPELYEIRRGSNIDLEFAKKILESLHDSSLDKISHFDNLRHKYLIFAFGLFSALYIVGMTQTEKSPRILICVIMSILMIVLFLLDARIHKTVHMWRFHRIDVLKQSFKLINGERQDVSFYLPRILRDKKERPEWFNRQQIMYYFLIVGSISSYWIFELVKKP